jgi:outer membrane protein assembly factor BamE (lipoprotein component of BamABCDE complex)
MRQDPLSLRGFIVILIAGLGCGSPGCVTAERRANRDWNRVGEGMTRDDVVSLLGEADSETRSLDGDTWHYAYGSRPDPGKIAEVTGKTLAVLTVIGGFLLLLAYARNGPPTPEPNFDRVWPNGDGSTSSRRVHFRVVFDGVGKVKSVSGLEPCTE